jgi:hypothetical protein
MKNYILELSYLLALLPAIFTKQIVDFGISFGLPWTFNYILVWFLVLFFALLAGIFCIKKLKGRIRFFLASLAIIIPLGSYFAANPIYEGDFNKRGTEVEYGADNIILQDVLNYKSDFNGLVCVASPSCPFCIESVRDKVRALHLRGKVDVAVYLPVDDGSNFKGFREITQTQNVPMIGNSRPDIGFDIEESVIPVFLYIQNGKVIHVWRNEQLGFPALDWIEKALK